MLWFMWLMPQENGASEYLIIFTIPSFLNNRTALDTRCHQGKKGSHRPHEIELFNEKNLCHFREPKAHRETWHAAMLSSLANLVG